MARAIRSITSSELASVCCAFIRHPLVACLKLLPRSRRYNVENCHRGWHFCQDGGALSIDPPILGTPYPDDESGVDSRFASSVPRSGADHSGGSPAKRSRTSTCTRSQRRARSNLARPRRAATCDQAMEANHSRPTAEHRPVETEPVQPLASAHVATVALQARAIAEMTMNPA